MKNNTNPQNTHAQKEAHRKVVSERQDRMNGQTERVRARKKEMLEAKRAEVRNGRIEAKKREAEAAVREAFIRNIWWQSR